MAECTNKQKPKRESTHNLSVTPPITHSYEDKTIVFLIHVKQKRSAGGLSTNIMLAYT